MNTVLAVRDDDGEWHDWVECDLCLYRHRDDLPCANPPEPDVPTPPASGMDLRKQLILACAVAHLRHQVGSIPTPYVPVETLESMLARTEGEPT